MNLSTLFGFQSTKKQATAEGRADEVKDQQSGNSSGQAAARNLKPGQTIQGEVVSVKGNEVTIAVNKDVYIQARMTQDMLITPGQSMIFEVKSNYSNKLSLSPLYENLSQDPNALKALQAAGLPETPQSMRLVKALIGEGMPIDRNTLQQVNKQMMMNEGVDPVVLAQMTRLGLKITPENITQFEAYKNYEHQISQSILEIADGLTNTTSGLLQDGEIQSAVLLNKEVLNIFMQEGGLVQGDGEVVPEGNAAAGNGTSESLTLLEGALESIPDAAGKVVITKGEDPALTLTQAAASEEGTNSGKEPLLQEETGEESFTGDGRAITGRENTSGTGGNTFTLPLNSGERQQMASLLRDAGFSPQLCRQVAEGNISASDLMKLINGELQEKSGHFQDSKLADLFGSKEYSKLLKDEISKQWTLKPEELTGEGKVAELYRKLNAQTGKLTQALSQTMGGDTPLGGSVNQLSQNVNFMNQLNQVFTYVQLPLNLNGDHAHGELFVYTNKKNLAKQDGNISALLHLDMEYLGPVDIHVALSGQNVSTKFYLQEDSTIDLISDNIHILNDRLEKRGYSLNCEVVERDSPANVMEEMLKQDKNVSILSNYAFDARA